MLQGMISGVVLVTVFAAVAAAGVLAAIRLYRGARPPAGHPAVGAGAGPAQTEGAAHA